MFLPIRGGSGPLNNFAATIPPTVNDDTGDGYTIGSRWLDTTTGVMWLCRSASAGAAVWMPDTPHPGHIAGRYYPIFGGNVATNNVSSSNVLYGMSFVPEADITVQELSAWLVVGSAATSAKTAIYANKYGGTGNGRPFGAPISADETGQATTATGAKVVWPVTASLKKGIAYWFCFKSSSNVPTFTCAGTTSSSGSRLWGKSDVTSTNTLSISTPTTYAAAWPTFNGSETWTDFSTFPVLYLKA